MTSERLFYKGGQALRSAAVLEGVGMAVRLISMEMPVIPEIISPMLIIGANVLAVFGILAWYCSQVKETGLTGYWGFLITMSGLLLGMSGFFAPYIWGVYLIGFAILAAANSMARHYPSGMAWFWLLGTTIGMAGTFLGLHMATWVGTVLSCSCQFLMGTAIKRRFAWADHP